MRRTMKTGFLRELSQSRGRFISIMLLMFLSTFTLVGLKLVGPDIRMMANQYLDEYKLADISVISTYGLSDQDVDLLNTEIDDADIEYGYFTDVTVNDSSAAFRIFSEPEQISEMELVSGEMPTEDGEIAISNQLKDDYPLGSTITVEEKGKKVNNVLKTHEYKVVGYVNTLEILSTMDLGSTNVGTGTLNGYGVVSTSVFDSDVYMIARFYYDSLRDEDAFMEEYLSDVSSKKSEIEAALKSQPKARLASVKSDANAEIEENEQKLKDAETELDDGKAQLADTKVQLDDAKVQLDDAKVQLDDGQTQIDDGKAQIADAKTKVEEGTTELESNKVTLDDKQAEVTEGLNTIASKQAELDSSKQELDTNAQRITDSINQLESGKTKYEAGLAEIQSNIANLNNALLDPNISPEDSAAYTGQLTVLNQTQAATQSEYDSFMSETYTPSMTELNAGQVQVDDGYAQIAAGQTQLDEAKAKLQDGQAQIDAGYAQIEAGYTKLAEAKTQIADNQQKLEDAQAELDQRQVDYNDGLGEYNDGLAKYNDGLAEYNDKEPQAREDIAEGYQQIADAKADLDDLSLPVYTVNTRSETTTASGYQVLTSLATSIDKIANVFPILLYAVAALVTFTTMTRYVEDERINTGTLLSLGYTESEIIKKYVIYGALSSSVGAVLGIILGAWFIPVLLYAAFRGQFTTPDLILTFNFTVAAIAIVVSMLCAVIPAFMVSSSEFKHSPASLLLPKPPSDGSKIFLERITPIWDRLSFAHKVTARNIFRYKKRMFMTIFGVSGSVALLFTGLAMQGSIGNISPLQFGDIIDYDMITVVDKAVNSNDAAAINDYYSSDIVKDYMNVYIENVSLEVGDNNERQTITLNVADNFDDYVSFRDRNTKEPIELKDGEVIISERLAQITDKEVGDTITVKSSENLSVDLKIGGITEMYMGHFMYATPATYRDAFGDEPKLNSYLVKLKDSSTDNVTNVATKSLTYNGVQTVMQNESLISQVDSMAVSLNSVMKLIIVLSGLLAIVILYNITNINVNERMRELSTTKVLGYYDNEVTMYIYRETMILSAIGIIVGFVFGRIIHLFMMHAVAPYNMMFDETVVIGAFIAPAILIIVVSLVLGILVHQKLKKVDMLEALKSVE